MNAPDGQRPGRAAEFKQMRLALQLTVQVCDVGPSPTGASAQCG